VTHTNTHMSEGSMVHTHTHTHTHTNAHRICTFLSSQTHICKQRLHMNIHTYTHVCMLYQARAQCTLQLRLTCVNMHVLYANTVQSEKAISIVIHIRKLDI